MALLAAATLESSLPRSSTSNNALHTASVCDRDTVSAGVLQASYGGYEVSWQRGDDCEDCAEFERLPEARGDEAEKLIEHAG